MQLTLRRTFTNRTLLVFTVVALALVALTAFAPTPAHAAQTAEPTLSCPAGYDVLGEYSALLAGQWDGRAPWIVNTSVNLPADMSSVFMTVWTATGHPERGCLMGDNNDNGAYPCDQPQLDEELYVDAFGGSTFVPDHGTDQWEIFGNINYGAQSAGTYPVTFRHSNEFTLPRQAESVTYKAIICGQEVPPPPTEWDKSSLYFTGSTVVANGTVSAIVCNGGSDMTFSTTWELYFATRGNAKRGSVIDSGNFGPLANGECTTLSASDQGLNGNFKFKAYQHPLHPGQGVLWSD